MLIYGFAFTTILGGLFTFALQSMDTRQKLREQHREQATRLFDELSPLMDTRLYAWRRVAWGLEAGMAEDSLRAIYEDYNKSVRAWNNSLNRNRALACRFFGPSTGSQLEAEIAPRFAVLQDTITKLMRLSREARPRFRPNVLNKLADPLNNKIYKFNDLMAEAIRSGKIGEVDPGDGCVLTMEKDRRQQR